MELFLQWLLLVGVQSAATISPISGRTFSASSLTGTTTDNSGETPLWLFMRFALYSGQARRRAL